MFVPLLQYFLPTVCNNSDSVVTRSEVVDRELEIYLNNVWVYGCHIGVRTGVWVVVAGSIWWQLLMKSSWWVIWVCLTAPVRLAVYSFHSSSGINSRTKQLCSLLAHDCFPSLLWEHPERRKMRFELSLLSLSVSLRALAARRRKHFEVSRQAQLTASHSARWSECRWMDEDERRDHTRSFMVSPNAFQIDFATRIN